MDPFLSVYEVAAHTGSNACNDSFVTPIGIPKVPNGVSSTTVNSAPIAPPSSDTGTILSLDHASFDTSPVTTPVNPPTPIVAPPVAAVPPPPIRKSTRSHKVPSYLRDYSCAFAHSLASIEHISGAPFDIAHSLTYSHLEPAYPFYLMTITACHQEPQHFFQAVKDPIRKEAMDKEIQALEKNNTPLPPSKTPIGCKWVYRIKLNLDGTIERYQAQLMAKGYTQS